MFFSESGNLNFWHFSSLTLKKKSTVLDGFLSYLAQMIISMRGCVAYNDPWQWPISSKSFDLDFENRVHSVMFSVLDRLFPHLPQIITTIKAQWLATIRLATHSSLRRRREVIRLGDGKSDRWSQRWRFRLFSPSKRNNNSWNSYTSKNITFSSVYHLLLVAALQ